jgi:hypothetical protein
LHQLGFSTGADKAGENGKSTKFAARQYLGSRGILVDKEEDAIYSAF